MTIEPLGDRAFLLRQLDQEAFAYATGLERLQLPGILEVVASYDTVAVYTDPGFDATRLPESVETSCFAASHHQIPVCFPMGLDFAETCQTLRLDTESFVERFCASEYRCFAIGFCPGFPYLGYLSAELRGVTRRASPRTEIPRGSVAITDDQVGIYPLVRPGGWSLIGETPLTLVDVGDRYFPIAAGDLVSFYSIEKAEFRRLTGERL